MKIIDNSNNTIFGELNPGVVFKFPGGENVYMRTTEPDSSNCVNLTNGHLAHISGDDFVIVVDATLTLE
ncbi:MAG: hypothetical protein J6T10_28735 [Methanobrevibacter sp.]|nr:hypothetical protein [Methanobrevibacter sp.]